MPRILGAPISRPAQRRAIPPLWDGGRTRARGGAGGNYLRVPLGDILPGTLPCPSGSGTCPPFNASVEAWRDDVAAQAGTKPIDFLLAWMQVESNGNPCSWTSLQEAGVYQLMAGDNMVAGGTSIAQQHPVPPCVAGAQTTAYRSSLTDDQAYEQVRGGMQYIDYCISRVDYFLSTYGYAGQPGWTDSDWSYWAMVKQYHALPSVIPGLLTNGLQGGSVPSDWDAMMQYSPSVNTSNARRVGVFGAGGGSIVNGVLTVARDPFALLAVGGLVALYLLTRK